MGKLSKLLTKKFLDKKHLKYSTYKNAVFFLLTFNEMNGIIRQGGHMRLTKDDYGVIQKRMIDLNLKNRDLSEKLGYKSKRTFSDLMSLAKKDRGFIADDKYLVLKNILSLPDNTSEEMDIEMEINENCRYIVQVINGTITIENKVHKKVIEKIAVLSLSEAQRFKKIYSERYPDFVIEAKQKYKDGWKIVQI